MEDDDICLPTDTQKILNEFLRERSQREREEFEKIQNKSKEAKFEEDWQLSQFWYDDDTKNALGRVVGTLTKERKNVDSYKICLLSCPSLYATVKEIYDDVKIFEFDKRFAAFGDDFIYYDFNEAETSDYLIDHWNSYDIIIADPPFLSEECITKMSKIVRNLQKPSAKIVFCSGEIVCDWLKKLLDLKKCHFHPEHERNLGNEFVSYANFNLDALIDNV